MYFHNDLDEIIEDLKLYRIVEECTYRHTSFSTFLILDGSVSASAGSFFAKLLTSDILLLPPGFKLTLQPEKVASFLYVRISPSFILDTMDTDAVFTHIMSSTDNTNLKLMIPHLLNMAEDYLMSKESTMPVIKASLYMGIQVLQRLFLSEHPRKKEGSTENKRAENVLSYLNKNYRKTLSLQKAASDLSLTPQYLSSFFQTHFQSTFMDYVIRLKIKKAASYLMYTHESFEDISRLLGFKTLKSFELHTERITGKSPMALRSHSTIGAWVISFHPSLILNDTKLLKRESSTFRLTSYQNFSRSPQIKDISAFVPDEGDARLTKMPASWNRLVNLGSAEQLSETNLRRQLREIQRLLRFKYGRICRLLDLAFTYRTHDGKRYGFEVVFQILDFILAEGLLPYLELGLKNTEVNLSLDDTYPTGYVPEPETYYEELISVLPDFIRSSCNRYGIEEVSRWRFEVYFDFIFIDNTKLTLWKFGKYYKKIYQIIKKYLPDAKVGGPGFNTYVAPEKLTDALRMFESDDIRFDFISIYVFATEKTDGVVHYTLDKDLMHKRTMNTVNAVRSLDAKAEIWISEFNFSHAARNHLIDSIFMTSFLLRYITSVMDEVAALGYVCLSDVMTMHSDSDTLFFGGGGLYSRDSIKKPGFHAYSFLGSLGSFVFLRGRNYLFTSNSKYGLQGIVYHYAHITKEGARSSRNEAVLSRAETVIEPKPPLYLRFQFHNMQPGEYLIKTCSINHKSGNILHEWYKSNFLNIFQKKDIEFLKLLAEPERTLYAASVQSDGILEVSLVLAPLEVHLVMIDFNNPKLEMEGGPSYEADA